MSTSSQNKAKNVDSSTKDTQAEPDTKEATEDDSSVSRAWFMYKKMTVLPAQMGKFQSMGKLAYLLMSAIALYMVISITLTDKLYTDVNEQPTLEHILPDVLWCPYAPSDHLRKKTTDIVNSTRNPFSRRYKVWYMRKEVEALDMTDEELDVLAGYVKTGAIEARQREILQPKVKLMLDTVLNGSSTSGRGYNYETVATYYDNITNPDDLHALWVLLARPAFFDKLRGGPYQCWPDLKGTTNNKWCILTAEPVWVNDAYCVLFPFQHQEIVMHSKYWNIKHYMFEWHGPHAMAKSEGLGVKMWMGNLKMQSVKYEDMWTMYPKENDAFSYINYEAYKITNFENPPSSVCQDSKIFTGNSRMDNCKPGTASNYWMFKFGLWGGGTDLSPWFYPTTITHTTTKSSLTSIQRIQLYGGVFGFTTGLSLLQLFTLVAHALKKNINKNMIRLVELMLIMAMSVGGGYLAANNMQELMSNSRFVRTSEYKLLKHMPIVPHIVISQANIMPLMMLNHSKLAQYNVSVMLLRYITALSGVSVYNTPFYTVEYFRVHEEKEPTNMTVRNTMYDLLLFGEDGKTQFNPRTSVNLFTDQMDDEFERLAKQFSFGKLVAPYEVYKQFRVDLCVLIKLCRYKKTIIDNCCHFARYETFTYHRFADAITIRFPENMYDLDLSGDKNGIEVFFDPHIFKDANYQYAGPQKLDLIRQLDFSKRGLTLSYVDVMLFDGKEKEKRSHGASDRLSYDKMETPGMLLNAGFTVSQVMRLDENEENNCRLPDPDCEVLGLGMFASDVMARALAEKTMCKCHICHSTAPNEAIAKLWNENGCCSGAQASYCLKQPINCCQNGAECCFHPVKNDNQTCSRAGRFVQTLLFNREADSISSCSPEYEITSPTAAMSGSVVSANLLESDREKFKAYNATCSKSLCERKTFDLQRSDMMINTDEYTSKWFGIRVFISMDYLLTSVEEDRFSLLQAVIQLVAGFGLLFGMSLLTIFEMMSASFNWLRYTFVEEEAAHESTEKPSFMSLCHRVLVGRARRSVDVFFTDIKEETLKKAAEFTNKTQMFVPVKIDRLAITEPGRSIQSLEDLEDHSSKQNPVEIEDYTTKTTKVMPMPTEKEELAEKQLNGYTHALISLICLAAGMVLTGYATYELIAQISANNVDAIFDVSFNGTLKAPSMALCVRNKDYEQLLNLTKHSVCQQYASSPTGCDVHFNICLRNAEDTCLVKDETRRSRYHSSNLRRFEDYSIIFPKLDNGLTQLDLWFGDLPSVRNGRLSPTEPFALAQSTDMKYTVLRSIQKKNCNAGPHEIGCEECDNEHQVGFGIADQCCLHKMEEETVNLLSTSALEQCTHNYYSVGTIESNEKSEDTITVRVIDYYGVVEVVTQDDRLSWPIILSSLFFFVVYSLWFGDGCGYICRRHLLECDLCGHCGNDCDDEARLASPSPKRDSYFILILTDIYNIL